MDYEDEIDAMREQVDKFLQKHSIGELMEIVGNAIDLKIFTTLHKSE